MEIKHVNDRLYSNDKVREDFLRPLKADGHHKTFRTKISAYVGNEFGECLFKDAENETVLGGAQTVLEKLWGIESSLKVASINSLLGINDIVPLSDSSANNDDIVCLWGAGIGGSGDTFGSRRAVNFYEREVGQNGQTDQMIPFRVVTEPFTSTDDNYEKYYMLRHRPDGLYEYYLKAFETTPIIKTLWVDGAEGEDGSEVEEDVYNTNRTDNIETFVEMRLKIGLKDFHEYFEHMNMTHMTRINTLALFTARRTEISTGVFDYTNVKLFSKLNMENESLINAREILYIYRVYVS